ncbi:MAG: DNA polymerase III subunit delta [Acidobacteria bacterium]|nr:DNA polymerase III subunit delta [Acidobacteriota bacterium]
MPLASPAAVRKQIQSALTDPIYLILGEEEVEKSALASEFADLVDEGLRAFNVERIHVGELTTGDKLLDGVASIVASARTLPMMSPRRVVIVFQAETLLAPKRESDAADRALKELESLITMPDPQTTLVLVASAIDRRKSLCKLLLKQATIVECGAPDDLAAAERWVRERVAKAGAEIEPAGARVMAALAGFPERAQNDGRTGDVKRLRGEVDRLLIYALGQKMITADDARAIAGPAAIQDHWAMTNAVERGQAGAALRQLALMLESGTAPEMILGQLGWMVRSKFPDIAPAAARGAVESLFRTDVDLKRSAGDPRVLLERLVVELCAGTRNPTRGRSGAW